MLLKIYRKITREFQLRKAINSAYWIEKLKYYGLTDLDVSTSQIGELSVKQLGVNLAPIDHVFLLEGYSYARNLLNIGAKFRINQNSKVQVEIGDLQFEVCSKQELFILDEIYAKNCYNYVFEHRAIVIDIGFNVGFTSLFFAQNSFVDRVYAFEPFTSTFKFGENNLSLNIRYSKKISAFNYGLGAEDQSFVARYDTNKRGNSVAKPLVHADGLNVEQVTLRNISRVFEDLQLFNSNKNIVIKMDCEGGEYELIDRLDEDGLLPKIEALMIEWHIRGPEIIESVLLKNGFRVFSVRESKALGIIYATKCSV
jgi:FkbM family methyltransferase